jgi:peptidoglycan/xylan/chitin deacetylase (PgdA/CDA1 family)
MRVASACAILVAIVLAAYATWAQTRAPVSATSPASAPAATTAPTPAAAPPSAATAAPAPVAAPAPTLAAGSPPAAASAPACAGIPNALGLARVVEIDTASGPGFGWEHFKMHDFLRNGEVVLTFDDGPWPGTTPAVLKALADHCIRATFFPIGKHATYHPDILKQVAAAGHSIGNHTWGHKDLSKKPYDNLDLAKEEIEKGISAVRMVLGVPGAPFFRFPALKHPPELVSYLGQRNIGIFSTDFDSFDFTMRRSGQVIKSVMTKLQKHGKGIVLMHDFQQPTADALPELLRELKANGYKIVHMKPKDSVRTLAQYDELVAKEIKLPTVSDRPTSSVVRTISE